MTSFKTCPVLLFDVLLTFYCSTGNNKVREHEGIGEGFEMIKQVKEVSAVWLYKVVLEEQNETILALSDQKSGGDVE